MDFWPVFRINWLADCCKVPRARKKMIFDLYQKFKKFKFKSFSKKLSAVKRARPLYRGLPSGIHYYGILSKQKCLQGGVAVPSNVPFQPLNAQSGLNHRQKVQIINSKKKST
jgi:hypothetical protein